MGVSLSGSGPSATPKRSPNNNTKKLIISLADKSDEEAVIALAISQNYLVPRYWSWMGPRGLWAPGPYKCRSRRFQGFIRYFCSGFATVEWELTTQVFKIADKGTIVGFIIISEPSKAFDSIVQ